MVISWTKVVTATHRPTPAAFDTTGNICQNWNRIGMHRLEWSYDCNTIVIGQHANHWNEKTDRRRNSHIDPNRYIRWSYGFILFSMNTRHDRCTGHSSITHEENRERNTFWRRYAYQRLALCEWMSSIERLNGVIKIPINYWQLTPSVRPKRYRNASIGKE